MEATTYTTVDKVKWGAGEWQSEPDKISWTDEATGLPCLIVRGPGGALCGYAGVHADHPAHGRHYWPDRWNEEGNAIELSPVDQAIYDIQVHGGLTFAEGCQHGDDPAKGVCHIPQPGEPDDVYWFGFDCAHGRDFKPGNTAFEREHGIVFPPLFHEVYRNVAYVQGEVASLAAQLKATEAAA